MFHVSIVTFALKNYSLPPSFIESLMCFFFTLNNSHIRRYIGISGHISCRQVKAIRLSSLKSEMHYYGNSNEIIDLKMESVGNKY